MLDCLLQTHPQVDASTVGGDTALHLACLHGNTDAAVLLLENGAQILKANRYGNAPLHLASVRGDKDTVRACVTGTQCRATHPCTWPLFKGKRTAAQCLMKYDADVGVQNREKNTALLQLAATWGHLEVVRLLTEANCDVNVADRGGATILHECARGGRADVVRLLLDTGRCSPDAQDSKGDTPLLAAARCGFADIVECLALCGADTDFRACDGSAATDIGVRSGNVELVSRMAQLGADLNARNSQGSRRSSTYITIPEEGGPQVEKPDRLKGKGKRTSGSFDW